MQKEWLLLILQKFYYVGGEQGSVAGKAGRVSEVTWYLGPWPRGVWVVMATQGSEVGRVSKETEDLMDEMDYKADLWVAQK